MQNHPPTLKIIVYYHPLITPPIYLFNININIHLTGLKPVKQHFVKPLVIFAKDYCVLSLTLNYNCNFALIFVRLVILPLPFEIED